MDCSRSTPLTTLLLVLNECARQLPSDKLVPFQTFCSSNYNYLSYLINHILSGNHLLASVDCFSTAFLIFGPKPTVFQIQPATMPQTTKEWNFLPIGIILNDLHVFYDPLRRIVLPPRSGPTNLYFPASLHLSCPKSHIHQPIFTYVKSHIHQAQIHVQPFFQYLRTRYEWRPIFGSLYRPFFVPDHPSLVVDNLRDLHSQSTPNTFNFLLQTDGRK